MRRKTAFVLGLIGLIAWGCTTSWEKHRQLAASRRAAGDVAGALEAQKWLVEHGPMGAPPAERGPAHDAARLMDLAELLGKSGQVAPAIEVYREALRLDPSRLEAVLTGIGLLPISYAQRDAYMDEIIQNALAIDPKSVPRAQPSRSCWSYTAREVRVRRVWTRRTVDGLEREAIYDARSWAYDAAKHTWRPDGGWVNEAGAEVQAVNGPKNPHYAAILDADGGFYADGIVPGCHASAWNGPYDASRGQVYSARRLPDL